jgi:hypothetical protein
MKLKQFIPNGPVVSAPGPCFLCRLRPPAVTQATARAGSAATGTVGRSRLAAR